MTPPFGRVGRDRVPARGGISQVVNSLVRRFGQVTLVLFAALALCVGAGVGIAYGYFTSTSSGTGHATVGSVQHVTVLVTTGIVTPKLQPNHHAGLRLTISNPNTFTVTIVHITEKSGTITVSGAKGACTGSSAGVSVPARTITETVPTGTHTITIATGAYMSATSPTGCQGATFSIPVTITVDQ